MFPKDQQFDRIFRDKVREHSSAVSADAWRQIRSKIDRRRRRIFFWPFFVAVPAACLFIFVWNRHVVDMRPTTLAPALSAPSSSSNNPNAPVPVSTSPSGPVTKTAVYKSPDRSVAFPSTGVPTIPVTNRFAACHLPALARLSTRTAITAFMPRRPSPLKCPNSDVGSTFFDHFYLSLYGAFGLHTHYFGPTYAGGIRLTMQVTSRWSATAGLQFSRTDFRGISYDSVRGGIKKIDLPILIGYSVPGDRYNFTVNGGVVLNLYTRIWTQFYTQRLTHVNPTAYLGFAYTRSLGGQWSVFAEPYLLYTSPNKNLWPGLPTWSMGLQLGLRYHL